MYRNKFVVLFDGFKFGMILQLAVGPICLMVFKTSGLSGLKQGLVFVAAVALIDALYIFLASVGMASILENNVLQKKLKYFGSIILILFGINIILGCFNYPIIPNIKININHTYDIFIQGLILTLSNPLTIIFWGGVFSGKVGSENYTKRQIFLFGTGCAISTIFFLGIIAIMGTIIKVFLPEIIIKILNGIIGMIIIAFGIKMIII
jgi:threonine/homoserine/homoserine lactone efflux protein